MVADVWEKDIWDFQARSGSSSSCCLFLHFLGKIAVPKMSGKAPGSPRHPSSRHPRPSGHNGSRREKIKKKIELRIRRGLLRVWDSMPVPGVSFKRQLIIRHQGTEAVLHGVPFTRVQVLR